MTATLVIGDRGRELPVDPLGDEKLVDELADLLRLFSPWRVFQHIVAPPTACPAAPAKKKLKKI